METTERIKCKVCNVWFTYPDESTDCPHGKVAYRFKSDNPTLLESLKGSHIEDLHVFSITVPIETEHANNDAGCMDFAPKKSKCESPLEREIFGLSDEQKQELQKQLSEELKPVIEDIINEPKKRKK